MESFKCGYHQLLTRWFVQRRMELPIQLGDPLQVCGVFALDNEILRLAKIPVRQQVESPIKGEGFKDVQTLGTRPSDLPNPYARLLQSDCIPNHELDSISSWKRRRARGSRTWVLATLSVMMVPSSTWALRGPGWMRIPRSSRGHHLVHPLGCRLCWPIQTASSTVTADEQKRSSDEAHVVVAVVRRQIQVPEEGA